MLSEVLLGAITNFVTSSVARVFQHAHNLQNTTAEIKTILQGEPGTDSTAGAAETLLVRVLGNQLGIYDTKLANIINDITLNGYPDALFRSCLTARHKLRELKLKFISEYEQDLSETSITADNLFDALLSAVESVALGKYSDRKLALLVADTHADLCYKIDRYCDHQEKNYPKSRLDDLSIRYAKFTQAMNKDVSIETDKGQKKISIEKIFVKSRLIKIKSNDIHNGIIDSEKFDKKDSVIKYSTFSKSLTTACVIGNPGGGKSTLCQFICYDFAKKYTLAVRNPGKTDLELAVAKIPLKIVMRNFKRLHENSNFTFIDFLVSEIRKQMEEDEDFIREWIKLNLQSGKAVVLFDGLDEILDIPDRRTYVELIEAFVFQWPSCPYICTSRKVGYLKAPLGDRFQIHELAPFSNDEIETYATNVTKVIKSVKKGEAEELARDFIAQTANNAQDLRSNPLMLGLMVWLYLSKGHVPKNRASIYSECALLMFEKWDPNRGIVAPIPDDFNLVELFGYLATKILGDRDAEAGVSSAWIEARILKFLTEWYESPVKATSAARKIKEFVTGRSWVMTDIGPDVFGFTHRTFLEYFYAVRLDKEHETIESLLEHLRPFILEGTFDVICHLAIQRKCENNRARSSKYLSYVTALFDQKPLAEDTATAMRFLANSMEYMAVSEFDIRATAKAMINVVLDATTRDFYQSGKDALYKWLENTFSKREINESEIWPPIKRGILSTDNKRSFLSVDILRKEDYGRHSNASMIISDLGKKALRELRPLGERDIFKARLAVHLDRAEIDFFIGAHDTRLLTVTADIDEVVLLAPLFYLDMWLISTTQIPRLSFSKNITFEFMRHALDAQISAEVPMFGVPHRPSLDEAIRTIEQCLEINSSNSLFLETFVALTVELLAVTLDGSSDDSRRESRLVAVLLKNGRVPSDDFTQWMDGAFSLLKFKQMIW